MGLVICTYRQTNSSPTKCTKSLRVDSSGKSHTLTHCVHHKLSKYTWVQYLPLDYPWKDFTISRCLDAADFNKCLVLQ